MKIIIKTTNLELTPEIENYVYEKIGGVNKFLDDIDKSGVIEAEVEIGRTTKHHQSGDIFRAEVNLVLPGKMLRTEAEERDLRTAIDRVKDELQMEIKKYRGKQEAIYKRGARKIKKMFHLSPLIWFGRKAKKRERDEGM